MKQTEIGEIPEDWQISDLKSVTTLIQNGLFFEPKRKGKGIPLINVGDMYKSSPIAVEELDLFDANSTEKNIYKVKDGDLLFTRSSIVPSGIAFCNVYFEDSKNIDVVFDSHLIKATPKSELVDSKYLYLNCTSKVARNYFVSVSKSAIMTTIDQQGIRNCPVLLPPRQEQKNISTVLADTDNLIQATEQLINKKQLIKTATMQNLLTGKIRLAEFDTKKTKPSELGEIPSDWDVVKLKEITQVKSGGTPSTNSSDFWNGNINWCTPTDITKLQGRKYLAKTQRTISQLGLQFSSAEVLPIGSIVMTSRATIGECAITTTLMTTNQGFKNFICHDEVYNEFLYYLLGTQKQRFINLCSGSTFLEISTTQVQNFSIVIPKSKKEQIAIANILMDIDKELGILNQRLTKLNDIKQGLMQDLLTGKIRLTE